MFTDLIVEGYQSLHKVRVRLGRLTVVTGPTGSGKSGLFRAVRLVAFNARGTGYITQGEPKAIVGIGCQDEGWAVSITRGARGQDAYRVSALDPDGGDEPRVWEYTKLAGKVPAEVSEVLNLAPINFAGQFDSPYLLQETAGNVAKTLGLLTNVTLIFNAAREAGRRRKVLLGEQAALQKELARLQGEAQRFATLRERIEAVHQAEDALEVLDVAQGHVTRLEYLHGRLSAAQRALDGFVLPPAPPDLSELDESVTRIRRLEDLLSRHQNAVMNQGKAADQIAGAAIAVAGAEQQVQKVLEEAGRCPVCGQEVHAGAH